MTFGYPDYSRLASQAASNLLNVTYTIAGSILTPVIDTLGYGFINLNFDLFSVPTWIQVIITWSVDNPPTILAGSTQYGFAPGTISPIQIPVIARYVQIEIILAAGGPGGQLNLLVFGSNAVQPDMSANTLPAPIIYINQSVAGNGSASQQANVTYQGEASICVAQGINSLWVATLDYAVVTNGSPITWNTFYAMYGHDRGFGGTDKIYLPSTPVRITLNNTDAAAHSMIGSLTTG